MHNYNSIVSGLKKTVKKLEDLVKNNQGQRQLHAARIESHNLQIQDHITAQNDLQAESTQAHKVANNLKSLLGEG